MSDGIKINLLLPRQKSIYSDLYNVFNDLSVGLNKIGILNRIYLINVDERRAEFPYNLSNLIKVDFDLLINELKSDEIYLIPDDFNLLNKLNKNGAWPKLFLIWAHYFYGHKFLFRRYRELPYENFKKFKWFTFMDFLPPRLTLHNNFYYKALYDKIIVAQSLWTLLLLERVYKIPVKGILRIPVETEFYPFSNNKEHEALIYLGNFQDTDIYYLKKVLKIVKKIFKEIKLNAFGDERILRYIQDFKINYLGKLSREELGKEYSRHLFTIAPIYNGNFEMVPIQSLLCGTPVISFPQPFMEVTGETLMVANIENLYEVKQRLTLWSQEIKELRNYVRNKILEEMDNELVAKKLVNEYVPILYE